MRVVSFFTIMWIAADEKIDLFRTTGPVFFLFDSPCFRLRAFHRKREAVHDNRGILGFRASLSINSFLISVSMKSSVMRFFLIFMFLSGFLALSVGCQTDGLNLRKKSFLGIETKEEKEFRRKVEKDPFPTASQARLKNISLKE